MKVLLILPFENAENQAPVWAKEEDKIDFRRELQRATRCTLSFAATELLSYLGRTCKDIEVSIGSRPSNSDISIELSVTDPLGEVDSFILEPHVGGVRIVGNSRAGLLYGVYELIRMQGVRWYAPGMDGEYIPPLRDEVVLPTRRVEGSPSMDIVRGFDMEGMSKESMALLHWMARNRLNMSGDCQSTKALAQKLGMRIKVGGHIFEAILDPDRKLANGKTLWESHKEWFGLPQNGVRKKELAHMVQFCVSQPELREFLAEELIDLLHGKWFHADLVDIWNFDTWGDTCQCKECNNLGNSSDQSLFFISSLRDALDAAVATGKLDHNIRMVMAAYEGTSTIEGPQNSVPENLKRSGDMIVYYPINRCYAHDMDDAGCLCNDRYLKAMKSWSPKKCGMPLVVGEYYNVSKFEDLPLLFTRRIDADIKKYYEHGVRSMTYMHIPLTNWAMRVTTQSLYAQKSWDVNSSTGDFLSEFFYFWYGPYCADMAEAYKLIETAWLYISDWRAWARGTGSVLAQLQKWDGRKPANAFCKEFATCHFTTAKQAIGSGCVSIDQLQKALSIIETVQEKDRIEAPQSQSYDTSVALNPVEAHKRGEAAKYEARVGEDRRLLIYGIDSLSILVELVAYYEALFEGKDAIADAHWQAIEKYARKLDSYLVPMTFDYPGPGFVCKDALTRVQVRDVLRRCRKYRIEQGQVI